jgi:hypothetical protein
LILGFFLKFRSVIIRSLLLLLSGLFLLVLGIGVMLAGEGLHVDQLSFSNMYIKDAGLTWHNGLHLEISQIRIDEQKEKDAKKISPMTIKRGVKAVYLLQKLISSFTVYSFQYKEYNGKLLRQEQEAGNPLLFTLNSDDLQLVVSFMREQDDIQLILQKFASKKLHSSATGTFLINAETFRTDGQLQAELAGCLPVQLKIQADLKEIAFRGQENGEITTITPFVDLFGIDPDIQCWITDYLKGSRYHLQAVSGRFPWDDPAAILETLSATIKVDDCEYTFAQGFEPIKTRYTDVLFSEGILKIIPHDSSFYSQDGQKSWLDINFNDPDNILLSAYIKTTARANADIVNLVGYYDISLPFLQETGTIDTDLTLVINLNQEQVTASGTFDLDESIFLYQGQPFRVKDGRIELKGTDVVINALQLGYKKLFTGRIAGLVSFKESRTELAMQIDSFNLPLKESALLLDTSRESLQLSYHFWAGHGTLAADLSNWFFGAEKLTLDSFSMPFNLQELAGTLPPTRLIVSSMADFLVEGNFYGRKQVVDMDVTVRSLKTQFLALAEKSLPLTVHYDQKLHLTSRKKSRWNFAGRELTFSPLSLWYSRDQLRLENGQIQLTGFFDTFIRGNFDLSTGLGKLRLDELFFAQKDRSPWFKFSNELRLDLEINQKKIKVDLDELGFSLRSELRGGWDIVLSDLRKLQKHSRLLRRFKVENGSLHLVTASSSSPLQISGEISSAYDFLIQDGQPQSEYIFSGQYDETGLDLVINRDLHLHYDDTVEIRSRELGYNVSAIHRFRKDTSSDQINDLPVITLQASNSFLFFRPETRILADTITFTGKGHEHDLRITHGQGGISLQSDGYSFVLQGQQLDDQFINALFMDADFEGGQLTAVARGTYDKFTAVLSTEAILLKHYTLLNNILAVINTVPALITFSLPDYDNEGWPVDSMRLWFDYDQGIATVKVMEIDSSEMDMRGSGTVDLLRKQIDVDVNLITQAGQNMSKIPLVGYILAGEEQRPTLTFHVTGDLLDPKVDNTAFQEVMSMPFEMIYRTLATPVKWMKHF